MRGCTKDMVMKTLRSNFISSNISVHKGERSNGSCTGGSLNYCILLHHLQGGLYQSEKSREIPNRWGSVLHLLL